MCPWIDLVSTLSSQLSLPRHHCWWVCFEEKSARNSDLEKLRIEFPSCCFGLLNEFPALSFCGIDWFLGLFWMNPQETHSKVHRRKDTLEFSRAVFCILQTKSLLGRIRPLRQSQVAGAFTPGAGSILPIKFWTISQLFPLHIQITLRTQRYLK